MINFQNSEIDRLSLQYVNLPDKFKELLLWVTDRLGIVNQIRYELDWGNIILLMACYGKMTVIREIISNKGIGYKDERVESKYTSLKREWIKYLEDFRDEVNEEINEQFNTSVVSRLINMYEARSILNEIHSLENFFCELDTIKLFIIGSDIFFKSNNFSQRIQSIEKDLKNYIFQFVTGNLKKEYTIFVLEELMIRWLPVDFWWRHINWNI